MKVFTKMGENLEASSRGFRDIIHLQAHRNVAQTLRERNELQLTYIQLLEKLLTENNIPLPDKEAFFATLKKEGSAGDAERSAKKILDLLQTANEEEMRMALEHFAKLRRKFAVTITFENFGMRDMFFCIGCTACLSE